MPCSCTDSFIAGADNNIYGIEEDDGLPRTLPGEYETPGANGTRTDHHYSDVPNREANYEAMRDAYHSGAQRYYEFDVEGDEDHYAVAGDESPYAMGGEAETDVDGVYALGNDGHGEENAYALGSDMHAGEEGVYSMATEDRSSPVHAVAARGGRGRGRGRGATGRGAIAGRGRGGAVAGRGGKAVAPAKGKAGHAKVLGGADPIYSFGDDVGGSSTDQIAENPYALGSDMAQENPYALGSDLSPPQESTYALGSDMASPGATESAYALGSDFSQQENPYDGDNESIYLRADGGGLSTGGG